MQRLTIEQIHKEQQTKYNNNAISGLKELPMDIACESMLIVYHRMSFTESSVHSQSSRDDRLLG
jgi:hypothetical protein